MAVFKPTFLALLSVCCLHSMKGMGLCDFADKFPCDDNEGFACFQSPGCKERNAIKGQTTQDTTQQKLVTTEHATNDLATNPKTTDNIITTTTLCPPNMVYTSCTTCQSTCRDPNDCLSNCTEPETCVCADGFLLKGADCIPEEECGCFVEGEGVIHEGEPYVNDDCTSQVYCRNGQLVWNNTYTCSANAVCETRNNVHQCYLIDHVDCFDVYSDGFNSSDIYTIKPTNWPGSAFQVYCNMTDGGGWTVFQHREDGSVDFYQPWISYKEGFGSLNHEHWLGNDRLYYLTNQKRYALRIDFVNVEGSPFYAKFDYFRVNDESDNYRLSRIGIYSGNAGGSYPLQYQLGYQFSTYDQDHDVNSSGSCAVAWHGAWWYSHCHASNLNGRYDTTSCYNDDIWWNNLPGAKCNKYVEMKIRPY